MKSKQGNISDYQERTLLYLLDESEESNLAKEILESPLGLSRKIINKMFNNELLNLKDDLDKIKMFAAGISRTNSLSGYKLAEYYPNMFAFHQFFQSSFRARQGKTLEKIISSILLKYTDCDEVPDKVKRMQEILSESFKAEIQNLDIDVFGIIKNLKKIIILQLRSRDDTGGTTAKGSLVDFLRMLLRLGTTSDYEIHYLICIWDERDSQQKNSTISKMYSSLQEHIQDENDFKNNISMGYNIIDNISIKLAYGVEEIADSIFQWSGADDNQILVGIKNIISLIEKTDDLWLSYSIANIELETKIMKGKSNIEILSEKLENIEFAIDYSNYNSIISSVEELVNRLIPTWTSNTIPFDNIAEQALYLRDLLLLKVVYDKAGQM